jgi:pilus assembly protein CpaB
MNVMRIAILGFAAIAAGAAALLVRGVLGGGTENAEATIPVPQVEIVEVLVAADRIEPGRVLTEETVRWTEWPSTSLAPELVTRETHPEISDFITDAVARAPMLSGEPITEEKIARVGSGSFMAATIAPGKRAVSIPVSAESGAGGFILPNDRVDVILTRELGSDDVPLFRADAILYDVRVLAIDQVLRQEEEQEFVVAQTATLELAPSESELIAQAEATGTLSLALRGLGDDALVAGGGASSLGDTGGAVTVLRYGRARQGERSLITGGPTVSINQVGGGGE